MNKYITLFCLLCSLSLNAQTLRQAVLYSDAIAEGSSTTLNEQKQLRNDYTLDHHWQTRYSFRNWIKEPASDKVQTLIAEGSSPTDFFPEINNCTLGVAYGPDVKLVTVFYLKKEHKKWSVKATRVMEEPVYTEWKDRVREIDSINQIRAEDKKYEAFVSWMIQYEDWPTFDAGFHRSLSELDSNSIFMQYYRGRGYKGISAAQQQQLLPIVLRGLYDKKSYSSMYENQLIYLVYGKYATEIDKILLQRMYYECNHIDDEDVDISLYDLERTLKAFCSNNKEQPELEAIYKKLEDYDYISEDALVQELKTILQQKGLVITE